jgi:hypothetical protein
MKSKPEILKEKFKKGDYFYHKIEFSKSRPIITIGRITCRRGNWYYFKCLYYSINWGKQSNRFYYTSGFCKKARKITEQEAFMELL